MTETPIPNHIYEGDCLEVMRQWPDACVDHCIADPPFNMSKKKGLGWAFSSHVTMQETWDRFSKDEFFEFNVNWLREVCRVVKPNGNILVFGTYHNVYQLGFILRDVLDRRILNSIIWFKPNAQPNITARTLTESTEQIIWAVNNTPSKAKKWTFNYWEAKELAGGRQMRNLWEMPYTPPSERRFGKVPAQKPEALLKQLLVVCTKEKDLVLDCFAGTGTTGVMAENLNRPWILIEKEPAHVAVIRRRLAETRKQPRRPFVPDGDD